MSLLYPEGMLFPSIFWRMYEGSIVGAIPATLLNENASKYGFANIAQHTRCRLTSSGYQTSTNASYITWCYDAVCNEATNHSDTRMVINKGLTASKEESSGLKLRGGSNTSPLLDSIDSKQVIKQLMASQKYHPFSHFFNFYLQYEKTFWHKTN